MPILLEIFLCFAKIGLFTFGGGYAMLSIIEDTCVERKKWITHEDMMNVTVVAESTPGPVAINCATFVGYKQAGLLGSICATFGVVLPSFVIIFLISMYLDNFLEIEIVAKAFAGIRVAVGILILNAAVKMIKNIEKKGVALGILVCVTAMMLAINIFSLSISSILLMIAAAVFCVLHCLVVSKRKSGGDSKK